ncbi:MAG: glycosyltransferase family 4 protein [Acidobacteriota bacterium]
MARHKRLLVVVRWPLGGIRTYMRHVYGRLDKDWSVTILASSAQECGALDVDAREIGAELIMSNGPGNMSLFFSIVTLLWKRKFDLIQSQGFISAILAAVANLPFRIPHILTVHGVLETRLLKSFKGRMNLAVTKLTIRSMDVVYCVGKDIMSYLKDNVSGLNGAKPRVIAIQNGIETTHFSGIQSGLNFRKKNQFSDGLFLFGFLGRYMPQKGFDILIDAVVQLEAEHSTRDFKIVAMGNGDYQGWYMRTVKEKKIEHRFCFLPFQREMESVYGALDAVVMPSRWEAYPLVAAETLCSGIPLIASGCIGLREAVDNTPALVVPPEDSSALADAMLRVMSVDNRPIFDAYRKQALDRYDVRHTVSQVEKLFDDTTRTDKQG